MVVLRVLVALLVQLLLLLLMPLSLLLSLLQLLLALASLLLLLSLLPLLLLPAPPLPHASSSSRRILSVSLARVACRWVALSYTPGVSTAARKRIATSSGEWGVSEVAARAAVCRCDAGMA
jgi:hypothetical protein